MLTYLHALYTTLFFTNQIYSMAKAATPNVAQMHRNSPASLDVHDKQQNYTIIVISASINCYNNINTDLLS